MSGGTSCPTPGGTVDLDILESYQHYRMDASERRELRGRENRWAMGSDVMSVEARAGTSCTVCIESWDKSAGCHSSAFS